MKTPTSIRLTLLPRDPAQPALSLYLDSEGRQAQSSPDALQVVAVPGEQVHLCQLAIPTRAADQARAAARMQIDDMLATQAPVHIALAPAGEPLSTPRLVAIVDESVMAGWLDRCRALDITPELMLPDCLLLPCPPEGDAIAVDHDGMLLVREGERAFTAEPALAELVSGDLPRTRISGEAASALLCKGAASVAGAAPINLLQFEHAPRRLEGGQLRRRLAVLATLAALSPLALTMVETLRDLAWTHWAGIRADLVAVQSDPSLATRNEPADALRTYYHARTAPTQLATRSAHLFEALTQIPEARLDSFESASPGELRAGVVHPRAQDIERLRELLAAHGMTAVVLQAQPLESGVRSLIAIEDLQ